jgi:hypothetical protein
MDKTSRTIYQTQISNSMVISVYFHRTLSTLYLLNVRGIVLAALKISSECDQNNACCTTFLYCSTRYVICITSAPTHQTKSELNAD